MRGRWRAAAGPAATPGRGADRVAAEREDGGDDRLRGERRRLRPEAPSPGQQRPERPHRLQSPPLRGRSLGEVAVEDELRQQRPRGEQAEQGAERRPHPVRPARVAAEGRHHGGGDLGTGAVDRRQQQLALAGEVRVEGLRGHRRLFGDLLHRRLHVPLFGEQGLEGAQSALGVVVGFGGLGPDRRPAAGSQRPGRRPVGAQQLDRFPGDGRQRLLFAVQQPGAGDVGERPGQRRDQLRRHRLAGCPRAERGADVGPVERPVEHPRGLRPGGEGLDQAEPRRGGQLDEPRRQLRDRAGAGRRPQEGIEGGEEAGLLVGEEVVEGTAGDAGDLAEIGDPGGHVAAFGGAGDHRAEEPFALVLGDLLGRRAGTRTQHPGPQQIRLSPGRGDHSRVPIRDRIEKVRCSRGLVPFSL